VVRVSGARRAVGAAAVLVSVATGIVTNLITSQWSWALASLLGVLTLSGIALALLPTDAAGRAEQRAVHGGRIARSALRVRGGQARQTADGGTIEDSGIEVE
jgi:hypothetical protein